LTRRKRPTPQLIRIDSKDITAAAINVCILLFVCMKQIRE